MANKLTKERNRKRQPTNRKNLNMADRPDYETLACNIFDFTNTALWVEKEIESHRASDNKFDLTMTVDGRTPGAKWASMKTVSHFNLGIALELMLKFLLLRNGEDYDRTHPLTKHYKKLKPAVQQQLESTYQDTLRGCGHDCVALIRQPPTNQPPLENRPMTSLMEIFEYFDEDVELSLKRYEWGHDKQGSWRHYLNDLSPFIEFIRVVMWNTERYIGLESGREHI